MEVKNTKKPKWLKILEKQSWQAELVISGVAIFGTIQLPGAITRMFDKILFRFMDDYLHMFYFLSIYALFAAVILITMFIFHFAMRALWVGLLGLNSVYPKGINPESENFSKDYLQKFKKDYPDINQFNKELDDRCSVMFASAAYGAMSMISIMVILGVAIILSAIIHYFIPSFSPLTIVLIMTVPFLLASLIPAILNSKKIRNSDFAKKYQYPLTQGFGKYMYGWFRIPISYISMTFITNQSLKKFFSGMGLNVIICMVLTMVFLIQSNYIYLMPEFYHRIGSNPHMISHLNYENLLPEGTLVMHPTIQSDQIVDANIRLFIPFPERQQESMDDRCGSFEKPEGMTRNEARHASTQFKNECAAKYFTIRINDIAIDSLTFFYSKHSNNEERGFVTYIPTPIATLGHNLLEISMPYFYEEGKPKVYRVPFVLAYQ